MYRIAAMRISPKSGVAAAVVVTALLASAAPASAGLVTVQPGPGFTASVSYPNFVDYGQRARISGHISQSGWKVTLFVRAAGEKRFHPAGSTRGTNGGHDFSLRTGRLTRNTRFRLAYTKGRSHA